MTAPAFAPPGTRRHVGDRVEDWEDSPPGWPQHPTYG
jgi:hypothetical protein